MDSTSSLLKNDRTLWHGHPGRGVLPSRAGCPCHKIGLFACMALVVILVGCGGGRLERCVVTGAVTYCGEPIKSGQIRFVPTKENHGPMWGAHIIDGKYLADGKGGVPVGSYHVEILAYRVPERYANLAENARPPGGDMATEQYLPAKFNADTTLEFVVDPGSGRIKKDFNLTD